MLFHDFAQDLVRNVSVLEQLLLGKCLNVKVVSHAKTLLLERP